MIELDFDWLNHELITKEEERASKVIEWSKQDLEFTEKMDKYLMEAPGSSQPTREAQARKIMQEQDSKLWVNWHANQLDIKLLKNRIDVITTICANLRSMAFGKKEGS